MESPPALARLRAVAGQLDAPGAVAFVLHCFLDEELAGGAFERETAGEVETVKYACGVQIGFDVGIGPGGGGMAAHRCTRARRGAHAWCEMGSDPRPGALRRSGCRSRWRCRLAPAAQWHRRYRR